MNLKPIRLEKGLSQTDMAKLIGVSLTTYILWEKGAAKPNEENMKKLIKVLETK